MNKIIRAYKWYLIKDKDKQAENLLLKMQQYIF